MIAEGQEVCALCKHFKMKAYPQHAREGLGRCMGYDKDIRPLINPFVPWSKKKCVRYARPPNRAERVKWVEARMAKQQQTVVQTETKG